jgi:hypothetical protein
MTAGKGCLVAAVLLLAIAGAAAAQAPTAVGAGVPPDERMIGALALVDLRTIADYDFTVDKWPKLGVTPWPLVTWCLPPSEMSSLFTEMEAALNRQDIPAAFQSAADLAAAAGDVGLGVTAVGIAEVVAAYAEQRRDEQTRSRMAGLIRALGVRVGTTPEYSAQGVPTWILALKPRTLFVGTEDNLRVLGLPEIQARFANMLDILSQDMARPRDLTVCKWHPEAPDHLVRDFWVLVQRFRIDAGQLACLLADGKPEPAVGRVSYFNGSWGLVREIAPNAGCSTRGAYATWK